jgi:hypothetical protein
LKRSRPKSRHKEGDHNLNDSKALRIRARRLLAQAEALRLRTQKQIQSLEWKATELNRVAEEFDKKELEATKEAGRPPGAQQAGKGADGAQSLPEPVSGSNVIRMLTPEHVLAISKGRAKKHREPNPLLAAAQASGMSLRGLARAVEKRVHRPVPISRITMARRGVRPIDGDIARAIEELTGFRATAKNWRGGIADS